MSHDAVTWARKIRVGSSLGKSLLRALADYADEAGSCFPGQARLADECECSERAVRDWLTKFEEAGWIRRERRQNKAGHRTSDRFVLAVYGPLSGSKEALTLTADDAGRNQMPTGKSEQAYRQMGTGLPANGDSPYKEEPPEEPPVGVDAETCAREIAPSPPVISKTREDLDQLENQLRDAAGLQTDPSPGLFDLSPILGLLDAGLSLEEDVLPSIRAVARKAKRPPRSWRYFTDAVREMAAERRDIAAAGRPVGAPRASPKPRRETAAAAAMRMAKELAEQENGPRELSNKNDSDSNAFGRISGTGR